MIGGTWDEVSGFITPISDTNRKILTFQGVWSDMVYMTREGSSVSALFRVVVFMTPTILGHLAHPWCMFLLSKLLQNKELLWDSNKEATIRKSFPEEHEVEKSDSRM